MTWAAPHPAGDRVPAACLPEPQSALSIYGDYPGTGVMAPALRPSPEGRRDSLLAAALLLLALIAGGLHAAEQAHPGRVSAQVTL